MQGLSHYDLRITSPSLCYRFRRLRPRRRREDRSPLNYEVNRFYFAEAFLEEQAKRQALMVVELIDAIQAGIVSAMGVAGEEVFDRLENKYASMVQSENR